VAEHEDDPRGGDSELTRAIPAGMSEEGLVEAIVASGYPLQTVVASLLEQRGFEVTEEWAYEDPDTGVRRTMDVVADWQASAAPHATKAGSSTVKLGLVVECKQSRNPYVFFESVSPPELTEFPIVVGLGYGEVELFPDYELTGHPPHMKWNKAPFSRKVSVQHFLGVLDEPFVSEPTIVSAISKASPRGRRVELSGDEPYNALLMPLAKAAAVYRSRLSPFRSAGQHHDVRAVVALAVLDAPMLLAGKVAEPAKPVVTSWVRVIVHRVVGNERPPWWDRWPFEVVDVVHRSALERYLDEYALPYTATLWDRHAAHHEASVSGRTFVSSLPEAGAIPADVADLVVPPPG
jgi:hypothetical protein